MKRILYDKINGKWVLNEYKLCYLVKFIFIVIAMFITLKMF